MEKYIGLDIGGTTVKGVIIDKSGKAYADDSIKTDAQYGGDSMCRNIGVLIKNMSANGVEENDRIAGIGIGCPGIIDSANGKVVYSGNLELKDFPLAQKIEQMTKQKVRIANDANAAALGEAKFGAGKDYKNSILVTLGTGVGGGIIIDGKLFEGYRSAGAELGHMVIVKDGVRCTCGRRGCFEAYASASALVKMTKRAMDFNPQSEMWKGHTSDTVDGRTVFSYPADATAQKVIEIYLSYLACGLVNLANIFRPQVIMLGGGISGQGERLIKPLQDIMDEQIFGGNLYVPVKVVCATLANRAGSYGAASLFLN